MEANHSRSETKDWATDLQALNNLSMGLANDPVHRTQISLNTQPINLRRSGAATCYAINTVNVINLLQKSVWISLDLT